MGNKLPANVGIAALAQQDGRFGNVKLFDQIETPIAISESGYIGIYEPAHKKVIKNGLLGPVYEDVPETLTVLQISMINSIDLLADSKSGLGGALVGGLLFGGGGAVAGAMVSGGKVNRMDLQIKTKDFDNP